MQSLFNFLGKLFLGLLILAAIVFGATMLTGAFPGTLSRGADEVVIVVTKLQGPAEKLGILILVAIGLAVVFKGLKK